jgi:hypothetical protein
LQTISWVEKEGKKWKRRRGEGGGEKEETRRDKVEKLESKKYLTQRELKSDVKFCVDTFSYIKDFHRRSYATRNSVLPRHEPILHNI